MFVSDIIEKSVRKDKNAPAFRAPTKRIVDESHSPKATLTPIIIFGSEGKSDNIIEKSEKFGFENRRE